MDIKRIKNSRASTAQIMRRGDLDLTVRCGEGSDDTVAMTKWVVRVVQGDDRGSSGFRVQDGVGKDRSPPAIEEIEGEGAVD
jgi:hypothetical protein